MSKWNIGDKVYYFWHANDCSLVWDLIDLAIKEEVVIGFDALGNPQIDDMLRLSFKPDESFYQTKNEAIDAMVAYLNGIRDLS